MGIDGIRKHQESQKRQRSETNIQETRDTLDMIYRVEQPKRSSFVLRNGWYVLLTIIGAVLLIVGLKRGEDRDTKILALPTVQHIEQSSQFGSIDRDAWYAVHLIDENVYYGRLSASGQGEALILSDVFYVITVDSEVGTATTTPTATTTQDFENKLVLVKRGTEAHRPEDRIVISPDSLVFFERMKNDSPVVYAMEEYIRNNQ